MKIGLAIGALWYLEKQELTIEVISKIEHKLTLLEFSKFIAAKQYMPIWMSNVVTQYENHKEKEVA